MSRKPYKNIHSCRYHMTTYDQGRSQDLGGGAKKFFCSDLESCMSRSDMLRMAKPCSLLVWFGGMPPPRKKNFKWCNLVRFGVYFDLILSLKVFEKYRFLYKKEIFLIHVCYWVLLMENFLKTLRLMRFAAYFEKN